MKVIIPTAGKGTRLRPHTFTTPKTLIHVAGRPILDYLLEPLVKLPDLSELIFIVGEHGGQIREYVSTHYNLPATYLWQHSPQGLGHALSLAKERADGEPVLILLGDEIFECCSESRLSRSYRGSYRGNYQLIFQNPDTVIGVKKVSNPQKSGVVEVDGESIIRLIEKPKNPPTNLAIAGLYYIKNSELLFQCLDELIQKDRRTHDEYQLTDALQLMLEYGETMKAEFVHSLHCGTSDQLLDANKYVLENRASQTYHFPNTLIIPPVFIGENAVIERAIIGPHASIGSRTRVVNAIITDAIIHPNVEVQNALINRSIIGPGAQVRGHFHRLNIGGEAQIDLSHRID